MMTKEERIKMEIESIQQELESIFKWNLEMKTKGQASWDMETRIKTLQGRLDLIRAKWEVEA